MYFKFGVFLPIEVVQQADDAPELNVLRVEFLGEITQRAFEGFGVFDVELFFVVFVQQRECLIALDAGFKFRHGALLVVHIFG